MSSLQEATDYVALVFMVVMLLALLVLVIVGLVVKHKISKAKHNIEEKVNIVTNLPYIGKHIIKAVKNNLK